MTTQKPSSVDHEKRLADELAEETRARNSNGNQQDPRTGKPGGAERGGPGLDRAADAQPPDSTRPKANVNKDLGSP